jgi:hypothetical protein
MRVLMWIPMLIALTAGAGIALCAATGWEPHVRAMLAAAIVSLLAGAAAGAVLVKSRDSTQPIVAQAALVGLTLQMLASLALCGVVYLAGIPVNTPFALWLLAFYWATLTVLAIAFVKLMKAAPLEPAPPARP